MVHRATITVCMVPFSITQTYGYIWIFFNILWMCPPRYKKYIRVTTWRAVIRNVFKRRERKAYNNKKKIPSRSGFGPFEAITVARLDNLLLFKSWRARTADSTGVLSDWQIGKRCSVKKMKKIITIFIHKKRKFNRIRILLRLLAKNLTARLTTGSSRSAIHLDLS